MPNLCWTQNLAAAMGQKYMDPANVAAVEDCNHVRKKISRIRVLPQTAPALYIENNKHKCKWILTSGTYPYVLVFARFYFPYYKFLQWFLSSRNKF